MGKTVISVEHLSKRYDLGVIGTGTISRDLSRWWARLRGNPDPYQKVGQADYGNRDGDSIWALNDINFQVEQGQALGIIGANGAGKSTLLKILSRVTGPTSGVAKVKGRIGSLLEVGTGFHAELTGRENVYLNGAILGMRRSEIDRKFDEIVDFSGVEKFIDTPVKRYSSGMYVRLAFAVAAHLDPEILIVDEVLAVGDAEFQKKCLGKMEDVAGEGRTVLFVSHNMQMIRSLCPNSMLLDSGKITQVGDSEIVVSEYYDTLQKQKRVVLEGQHNNTYVVLDQIVINNNKPINIGQDIQIDLYIKAIKDVDNLSIGISFHDEQSRIVSIFYSHPKIVFSLKQGDHQITAKLKSFQFTPGNYTIRVRFERNGIEVYRVRGNLDYFIVKPLESLGHRTETLVNGRVFLLPEWDVL